MPSNESGQPFPPTPAERQAMWEDWILEPGGQGEPCPECGVTVEGRAARRLHHTWHDALTDALQAGGGVQFR